LSTTALAQFVAEAENKTQRADLGPKPACFNDFNVLDIWVATKEFVTEEFIFTCLSPRTRSSRHVLATTHKTPTMIRGILIGNVSNDPDA
jgi:hypothetical protein